ncbi:MAG: murein biosynthesis integral membrane protein MurJ [Pseudomonadota bacterium]
MLRSGFVVAFYTFLSRLLGLLRELFIANMFGSSSIADSVNVAFKLPNLFRRIFAEGALSSVFVPLFNEKLETSKLVAENFASKVFWSLLIVLILFVGLMQYFMPNLMIIFAPGFHLEEDKFELTVALCRITMPYLVCISIAALLGGMLNSIRKFAAFAFVPVLLNIVIITGGLGLQQYTLPSYAIAYSVTLGGIFQVLFMLCAAKRHHLNIKFVSAGYSDPDIKKLLKLMLPATISSGAMQVNLFISQSIASFIPGAVSILSYADRLYQFPLSIIGIAFATVLLPELSKLYKSKDVDKIFTTQNNAIKFALFLAMPCAIGIILLSHPIICLIYEHGAFTSEDTTKTASALAAFGIGLPAFILSKIFTPIFYANQDTKTPMKITIYSLTANTLLNIVLMVPFGHIGIALGSSIAAWYNLWLLARSAKRNGHFVLIADVWRFIQKLLICSLALISSILSMQYVFGHHYYASSMLLQSTSIFATIIVSAVMYFGAARILGMYHTKFQIKLDN